MFSEEEFLSKSLISETFADFKWPLSYTVKENFPDGFFVIFPSCELYFSEDLDGNISLRFLGLKIQREQHIFLIDGLSVFITDFAKIRNPLKHLNLIDDLSIDSSEKKVKNNIRDICTILQEYFLPTIMGDFSWTEKIERITHYD